MALHTHTREKETDRMGCRWSLCSRRRDRSDDNLPERPGEPLLDANGSIPGAKWRLPRGQSRDLNENRQGVCSVERAE